MTRAADADNEKHGEAEKTCSDHWGKKCISLAWQNQCPSRVEFVWGVPKGMMHWALYKKYEHVTDVCCKTCMSGDICTIYPFACANNTKLRIKDGISFNRNDDEYMSAHLPLKGFVPTEIGNIGLRLEKRRSIHDEAPRMFIFTDAQDSFSGTVPTEIGLLGAAHAHFHLSALEPFELTPKGNRMSGTVPTEVGNLCQLAPFHLHLTGATLSGTIPTQIGNFANESCHLHLGYNRVSGTLPTQLGRLSQLFEFVELNDNSISGTIPTELGRMSRLEEVWLHSNRISGTLPTQLALLTSALDVRVAHNRLSGTTPSELVSLRAHAAHVDLGGNFFSGTLPSGLTSLSATLSEFGFLLPHSYATRDHHQPACITNAGDVGFNVECGDVRWPTACAGACWTQATIVPLYVLLVIASLLVLTASHACRAMRSASKKAVDLH